MTSQCITSWGLSSNGITSLCPTSWHMPSTHRDPPLWVCKNVSSKNKGRCKDGAVRTCKVWQNHLAENRSNKEEGRSMQRGGGGGSWSMQQGGPVHTKPRSLTCADFEYVFTIPTSANILLHSFVHYMSLYCRKSAWTW